MGPHANAAGPRSDNQPNRNPSTVSEANTVRLHRVLRAPAERVYRAFTDAAAMAKWLPPDGFTCTVHEMDAKEGGTFRMTFTNFSAGGGHSFGGKYLECRPGVKLRYTDIFDDPDLPGTMETAIDFREVSCGTEITVVQSGIPAMIPVEQCYLGWQQSLTLLGRLVEVEIPG